MFFVIMFNVVVFGICVESSGQAVENNPSQPIGTLLNERRAIRFHGLTKG